MLISDETMWSPYRAGNTGETSIEKLKLFASAQDPPVFRFSFSHPCCARRIVCVCMCVLHGCTCLHKHPRRLYTPWKGICFGSFPAFLGRGVMPSMPRPTVSDGMKRRNWVRLKHDDNVKRWGTESPTLPMQLSRIWKVKFSTLQHCKAGLSQDSTYCGEAFAWEILSWPEERIQGGNDGGKKLIWTDRYGRTAVGCKRPMEETREGREIEAKKRRGKVCTVILYTVNGLFLVYP